MRLTNSMPTLRYTVLPRALHRPMLIMGCDPVLLPVTALLCIGVIVISGYNRVAIVMAALLWTVCVWLLRMMGKSDPQMREVALQFFRNYKRYYPPRASPPK